ncbi:uncharacterized protein LOC125868691 [Solanum stenotomum]|uniref:uncharacterized protein LOC125868691 n=1 Tax=Solanum stenotomum TaxID=172797 RepID=UPI0020D0A76C|nr:uncharacterized protein LOC125868691 [Solanum stenotomum]
MPLRRPVRGRPTGCNVDEQDLPNSPEVQPQGEVTNVEFREAIRMLTQVVTNQAGQQRGARQEEFEQWGDGVLRYQGRLCVPMVDGLQERIMEEAHSSRYSIHPSYTKMYRDLKEVYWWNSMKKSIVEFVVKCPNCQQIKTDGQAERTIQTLEDMLRACVIDFKGNWDDHLPLIEFVYNNSYHSSIQMAPYEALFGRRYRSPIGWFEVGEAGLIGPDLVHQAMEKVKVIQERLKTAQSHQKSYTDVRRRALEFEVDDWVYLKVSPMKAIMRFGKKGKLSPRYNGPYQISKRIGNKCMGDPSLILPTENIRIKDSLSYEEIPVQMLDRQVRRLRMKDVASVKVLWRNQFVEEATWEAEEDMKKRYPHLFETGENVDQGKGQARVSGACTGCRPREEDDTRDRTGYYTRVYVDVYVSMDLGRNELLYESKLLGCFWAGLVLKPG